MDLFDDSTSSTFHIYPITMQPKSIIDRACARDNPILRTTRDLAAHDRIHLCATIQKDRDLEKQPVQQIPQKIIRVKQCVYRAPTSNLSSKIGYTGASCHILVQDFCIFCTQVLSKSLTTIDQYRISFNRNIMVVAHIARKNSDNTVEIFIGNIVRLLKYFETCH